ncbi:MAG: serine/threonine protein kinase [Candidatus Obscuribacterales bacterium]|nr:serine/threonine protein kinase [Candidatus Obscuribacterales bacterium]
MKNSDETLFSQTQDKGAPEYLSKGQILGDEAEYQILGFIGQGAAGQVYKVQLLEAEKNKATAQYALKILLGSQQNPQILSRFLTEIEVIARLDHGNIVKIVDGGLYKSKVPYYVMELVDGETLSERLKSGGLPPLAETLKIFISVADALNHAHSKRIMHRDIKPGNIVIANEEKERNIYARVKVVDFGIAKLIGRENTDQALTGKGEIFGSPLYMSPEQAQGGKLDERSDIYSLGCTLFECLTGRPPFQGRNIVETLTAHIEARPPRLSEVKAGAHFPKSLEDFLDHLLSKSPHDRPQSMAQVEEILESILEELGIESEVEKTVQLKGLAEKKTKRKKIATGIVSGDTTEDSKAIYGVLTISSLALLLIILIVIALSQIKGQEKNFNYEVHTPISPLVPPDKLQAIVGAPKPDGNANTKIASAANLNLDNNNNFKINPGQFFQKSVPTTLGAKSGLDNSYHIPDGLDLGVIEVEMTKSSISESAPNLPNGKGTDTANLLLEIGLPKVLSRVYKEMLLPEVGGYTFIADTGIADAKIAKSGELGESSKQNVFFIGDHPELLKGFRPSDLREIIFKENEGGKKDLSKFTASVLPYFTNLTAYEIPSFKIDQKAIRAIASAKHLKALNLRDCGLPLKALTPIMQLKNLSEITLSSTKNEDPTDLLTSLDKQNRLEKIHLYGLKASPALIKLIFSRPRRQVDLIDMDVPFSTLLEVAPNISLRTLHLKNTKLVPNQFYQIYQRIEKVEKLQYFESNFDEAKMKEVFERLHKINPRVDLFIEASHRNPLQYLAE